MRADWEVETDWNFEGYSFEKWAGQTGILGSCTHSYFLLDYFK